VLSTDNTEEALEEIGVYKPDLVITCSFNDPINTSEFIKEIKKQTHNLVPVILFTGGNTSDMSFMKPFHDAGIDDFLQKPCDIEIILKTVEMQLIAGTTSIIE
jgi:DNA-binding response OmpR family regulator